MLRRPFTVLSLLHVVVVAMWVRSYFAGDYLQLGPNLYLSFARGNCRVVRERWFFVPPYPDVGGPVVTRPLDAVGEYPLGSAAISVPLWLASAILLACGVWAWRRDRRRPRSGMCIRCGYDLTGNVSGTCPECGSPITVDAKGANA